MKTDTPAAPVIRIQGVSLRYGDNLALDNLNLDIPANRMVGLIGPDGVGKSSLMSLLTCARKMKEGRIIVLDGDIADAAHRRAVCPRIAYMPQGLGKNLYLTIGVRECRFLRPAVRPRAGRASSAHRRTARKHWSGDVP